MDKDSTNEEQPTSSRKDSQRINSRDDLYDDKRKYDERRRHHDRGVDAVSNSESFSSSYSGRSRRSRVEVAEANANVPKPPGVKREKEVRERATNPKKRRTRRSGKVQKRGRSAARRRVTRRAPRRRPRMRKERIPSVSTVFTRLSSAAVSVAQHEEQHLCQFCGHRCCRRRYLYGKRRGIPKKVRIRKAVTKMRKILSAKAMQAGSRSLMLSPLFINTNLPTPTQLEEEAIPYCSITPEMIFEAVRNLTMWRQYVQTFSIFQYMKMNFPVNPDEIALVAELDEKLRVAAIAEIITQESDDRWSLSCRLQNRYLSKNHVTRFWQVYGDTMRPVAKKIENRPPEVPEETKAVSQNQLEFLLDENNIV